MRNLHDIPKETPPTTNDWWNHLDWNHTDFSVYNNLATYNSLNIEATHIRYITREQHINLNFTLPNNWLIIDV